MNASARAHPALGQVLHRALMGVVLAAVLAVGALLTLLGTLALRSHAASNLALVARSAGYTVQAAVVFRDDLAASEALARIARTEDVAEAWVFDHDGELVVRWQRASDAPWQRLQDRLAWLLPPLQVEVPIEHDREAVGRVVLRSAGGGLVAFVLSGAAALAACLLASALATVSALQRVLGRILAPLRELAGVVRAVRAERVRGRRVPPARIAEFQALGEDMNALLDELETRHGDLQRENAHLSHRASHDSLTGANNRAFFEARLDRAVASAQPGSRLAVLFLDADGFKQINDRLGHEAGDAVLVAMAQRIRLHLREHDVLARLGGDEFAVLLDGLRDAPDAGRAARAIEAAMAEPVALPGGASVRASLSVGLAVFPDDAGDAAGLLRAADAAMYRRKRLRASGAG